MSRVFNIDEVKYENFNKDEINQFENLGIDDESTIEERKIKIKKKLAEDNFKDIEKLVEEAMDKDEYVELSFRGITTGMQYLLSTMYSADYYFIPVGFMDVGLNFIVYATSKKVFIFETKEYNQIQRSYEINYEDIKKFYYRKKKDRTILYFKVKKDKNDNLRECSSWILYKYYTGRISMALTCEDKDIITKYLEKKIIK